MKSIKNLVIRGLKNMGKIYNAIREKTYIYIYIYSYYSLIWKSESDVKMCGGIIRERGFWKFREKIFEREDISHSSKSEKCTK